MKTINDLYNAGTTDPIIHRYLTLVEIGQMTMEQAMLEMVFSFKDICDQATNNYVKHLERCTMPQVQP